MTPHSGSLGNQDRRCVDARLDSEPQRGLGSASRGDDAFQPDAGRPLHDAQVASSRESDALHDSPVEMLGSVRGAEPKELGARIAVLAEPLSCQIGHEQQAVAPGRRARRIGCDLFVGHRARVQSAPRPAHGVAAGFKKNERTPPTFDCRDVADFGIEERFFGDQSEDARRAGHIRSSPGRQAPDP